MPHCLPACSPAKEESTRGKRSNSTGVSTPRDATPDPPATASGSNLFTATSASGSVLPLQNSPRQRHSGFGGTMQGLLAVATSNPSDNSMCKSASSEEDIFVGRTTNPMMISQLAQVGARGYTTCCSVRGVRLCWDLLWLSGGLY